MQPEDDCVGTGMVEISWQPQTATDAVLMCFIRCPGGRPMGGRGEDGLMYVRSP